MIVPRYVPGDWVAAVSDGIVALLPGTVPAETVDGLWTSLREGEGLGEPLDVLVRGGLAALPPFALVRLADGAVQAVVRGAVRVVVQAEGGEHVLDGATLTTWNEASVPDARSVSVRASGASGQTDGPPDEDLGLPVLSAVVLAARVDVVLDRDPQPDSGPVRGTEPAPAPEPVPDGGAQAARRGRRAAAVHPTVPSPSESTEVAITPEPAAAPEPAVPGDAPADAQPSAEPARVPDVPAGHEDHDGLTVLSTDVASLRRQLPEWAGDAVPGPFSVPAPQAPPPAKIHLSSGLVISLNRPVLLGRAPQVSRVQNSQIPRLVTVASPNQDISRTHAEVRQDGEHVLVTDLRSTNGVLLLRQGSGPQRLHPGDPTVVEPGVVVDLGEGVTFVVEHTG